MHGSRAREGHRLELEWKAACGDANAAKQLGLLPDSGSSRKRRPTGNDGSKKNHPQLPFMGRGVSLFSVGDLAPEQARERIADAVNDLIRSG
jgi:hypothetical protein